MKSKVMTLANSLVGRGMGRSEAMKEAYRIVKTKETVLITFQKVSGAIARRVVSERITDYYTPVGGTTVSNKVYRFVDLAKVLAGESRFIISCRKELLISKAA